MAPLISLKVLVCTGIGPQSALLLGKFVWNEDWLFAQKPFDPPNRPKPLQTPNWQIFPTIRRCPGIPQDSSH